MERSYQISEEGNRIGLSFNLCVAPTCMICSMSYDFETVVGDQSQTEVGQGSDRGRTEVRQRSDRGRIEVRQRSDEKKIVRRVRRSNIINEVNEIIRLSCIEGNTRLIYRMFG